MDFIFNALGKIGGTIASFYADHPLAAALVTVIAIGLFWSLMGWGKTPDFSEQRKVAKNGLIVLIGWAIAVPILDFIFSAIAKILEWAGIAGSGLFWVWERFNEQPLVVSICLIVVILGFSVWTYRSKKPHTLVKCLAALLAFLVLVGFSVPVVNTLTKGGVNTVASRVDGTFSSTIAFTKW